MVLKTAQNLQSQSMNIHVLCSSQVANRTREAKLMLHMSPMGCRQSFVYIVPS
jgi:S-ribosylhomocysteine lyase LuxS involved in autoinducer biosynthesis